jgi:hypothetical protein
LVLKSTLVLELARSYTSSTNNILHDNSLPSLLLQFY